MSWKFENPEGLQASLGSEPISASKSLISNSDTISGSLNRNSDQQSEQVQHQDLEAGSDIQKPATDNEILREILQEHQKQKENSQSSYGSAQEHQGNDQVSSASTPAFTKIIGGNTDQNSKDAVAVVKSNTDVSSHQDNRGHQSADMSTIFDQSNSIMEHLLPSNNRHAASIPWSNYPMPIYSSFGISTDRCINDGDISSTHELQAHIISPQNDDNSSLGTNSKTIYGRNLLGRFGVSQLNNVSESSNMLTSIASQAASSGAQGHQRLRMGLTKAIGGVPTTTAEYHISPASSGSRSYSSVLNSQDLRNRLSMYDQLQLTNVPSNSNSMSYVGAQSSLIPTNFGQAPGQYNDYHHHHSPQARNQANEITERSIQRFQPHQIGSSYLTPTADISHGQQTHLTANGQTLPTLSNYFNDNRTNNFPGTKASTMGGGYTSGTSFTTNPKSNRRNRLPFFNSSSSDSSQSNPLKMNLFDSNLINSDGSERYSRKVFVGGLPPDIDEDEIKASFRRFGNLVVDWPHKAESKSYFPPKGYAFLLFHDESSVQALIDACVQENDKLYLCVSSPTTRDKPVQIRPWRLADADFVLDSTLALNPRKTVFVGGVPRPLKASELANVMNHYYGNVCYAGIDTDPELRYPKGAGRVAFSTHESYIAAINSRFVHLQHSEIDKRVEIKPYVLDDQTCDECQGVKCNNKFAPFFCAHIECLNYFCESCWETAHRISGKEFHKPMVKEATERHRGSGDRGDRSSYKWV